MFMRQGVAVTALAAAASLGVVAGPAQAVDAPASTITAKASNTTPTSGQTFRVSGLFMAQGRPANHLTVKVQSLNAGHWVQLPGAQVPTRSDGTYSVRLILDRKGARDLRVIGVVPGSARDAFKRFVVTVR